MQFPSAATTRLITKKKPLGRTFLGANLIVWLLSTAVLCSLERNLDGISPTTAGAYLSLSRLSTVPSPPSSCPPFSPPFLIYTPLHCCHAPLRFKGVTCDVMASGRAAECGGGHIYLFISVCECLRWEPVCFCMRVLPAERCQFRPHLNSGPLQMGPLYCAMHQ